jgi:hypothetical protein
MTWSTVHTVTSVAEEANLSPVKHFAGQDSCEQDIKYRTLVVNDRKLLFESIEILTQESG